MIRRRVVVKGRVQGVFYREGCRREAQRLGVRGWVLNRADGHVEAVLEGQPEDVEAMIEWARVGPLHAYVTGVDVVDEQPESLAGFEVR